VYCGDVSSLAALYAALHRNILDVFNEYGVQIMTPRVRGRSRGAEDVAPKDWHMAPAASREAARAE